MISPETIRELERVQGLLHALIEDLDESSYRRQFHPDLSALGWHLGHCTYVECYWLHEVVRGDDSVTRPLRELYVPPLTPKPERGERIPSPADMLDWSRSLQAFNRDWLNGDGQHWADHELLRDEYLPRFLIQHHSQHYETMLMALTQRALAHSKDHVVREVLRASPLRQDAQEVPGGHYPIGGTAPDAFDNELPQQHVTLDSFAIARHPVSNAEFLAFIEDNGYQRAELWSEEGNAWRTHASITHPDHWQRDGAGHWYGVGVRGPCDLPADAPVMGLSFHEADACARWAGARLPHEFQWETACRIGLLADSGQVWEWCANPFAPYEGFKAFPYPEYSTPWFDGRHRSLRGGSLHTQPCIKRPSFRNFYEPDKRHIFAGLRLVHP